MASSVQKLLLVIYFFVFLSIYLLSPTSSLAAIAGDQEIEAAKEAKALLKWKSSLDNQSQSILSSWNGSNPCNWVGIACNNDGSVTNISLGNYSLKGTLHFLNFWSFPNLVRLELRKNLLFGTIPSYIGNLSKLFFLDLAYNGLSGSIPSEQSLFSSLGHISLDHNNISGTIPQEIGKLRSLSQLILHENKLTGNIPSSMGNLSNLVNLYLGDNELSGSIPEELGMLRSLDLFDLVRNHLTGTIPSSIYNET
ncbi:hypothetical protein SCA6_009156 [Theobroma cacao]